jgi:hypothetical protein
MSRDWRSVLGVKRSWQLHEAVVWDKPDTFDRYTFLDKQTGDMWGVSGAPFSPQGFGQYIGDVDNLTRKDSDYNGKSIEDYIAYADKSGHLGKRVEDLTTLPEQVQQYIKQMLA